MRHFAHKLRDGLVAFVALYLWMYVVLSYGPFIDDPPRFDAKLTLQRTR